MGVPKRKTSKRRRDQRAANKGIKPGAVMACLTCKAPISPHNICKECGYYKGRKVLSTKNDRMQKRAERVKTKEQQAPTPEESVKE